MTMRWEKVNLGGGGVPVNEETGHPGKRWGHTCNSVKGGQFIYVFGGYGKDNCQSNKVHVFDTAKKTWSEPTVSGCPPGPRDSHSCTTVEDNLYVFGGTDGTRPLSDLHILDTASHSWISPPIRGDAPQPREGHSAALVGRRIFIFGGCGKSLNNTEDIYFNDLYVLSTETLVWREMVTLGQGPSPRDSHSCSAWRNKIVVIGGEDKNDYYLSDVHVLDTESLVWKELKTMGQKLPPRAGHATVAIGNNIFVFGGFSDAHNLFDDVYMLNMTNCAWTKVTVTGEKPSARFSACGASVHPAVEGGVVFFGGCNSSLDALDDLLIFHTGIVQVQEDHGAENISVRKHLKLKCQEQLQGGERKIFQAKVTDTFGEAYSIETHIDGKPLRGILFASRLSNHRKRPTPDVQMKDADADADADASASSLCCEMKDAPPSCEKNDAPPSCDHSPQLAVTSTLPMLDLNNDMSPGVGPLTI